MCSSFRPIFFRKKDTRALDPPHLLDLEQEQLQILVHHHPLSAARCREHSAQLALTCWLPRSCLWPCFPCLSFFGVHSFFLLGPGPNGGVQPSTSFSPMEPPPPGFFYIKKTSGRVMDRLVLFFRQPHGYMIAPSR